MFQVQFSYQPDDRVPGGLEVTAGAEVIALDRLNENWLTAKTVEGGKIGLVPTAYVQVSGNEKFCSQLHALALWEGIQGQATGKKAFTSRNQRTKKKVVGGENFQTKNLPRATCTCVAHRVLRSLQSLQYNSCCCAG